LIKSGTTLRITADPAVVGGVVLSAISVALPAPLPTVASVVIDDGTAQRSAVEAITLTFEGDVDIEADAISIVQRSDIDGVTGTAVDTSFTSSLSGSETVVDITFDSLTRNNSSGLLVDGHYKVTVDQTKVRLDGLQMEEDFTFGDLESDEFFSFYGDSNGDRTIDIFDLLVFRRSFGTSSSDADYEFFMDFDAGGAINVFDLLDFRTRFGDTLPFAFGSPRSSRMLIPVGKTIGTKVLRSRK